MAEAERERGEAGGGEPAATGERPHPRLRRAPFGFRRGDVDAALAARDAELAELRQDVAALWLAFAQHDRLLRESGPAAADQPAAATAPSPPPNPGEAAARAASIGAQLAELDHVLSAIEEATRTLERTYADEIDRPAAAESGAGEPAPSNPAPGEPARTEPSAGEPAPEAASDRDDEARPL